MKCAFTQDGVKIAGNCTGALGSTPATGSVAEDRVTFQHTVERDQVYQLTYSGRLDAAGTSMQGEIEVLENLKGGRSNNDIAKILGISEYTVKSHLKVVFTKLCAANRSEAITRALELGILSI